MLQHPLRGAERERRPLRHLRRQLEPDLVTFREARRELGLMHTTYSAALRQGRVAILAWSSEQLLPGYPLLEARLRATTAGLAALDELASLRGSDPEATLLDVYQRAVESVHPVGDFVRRVPDGPAPDEIVMFLAYADGGRPIPRCGSGPVRT